MNDCLIASSRGHDGVNAKVDFSSVQDIPYDFQVPVILWTEDSLSEGCIKVA